jgi:outer membrane murein-binding lipoprotein Lpp
MAIGIGEESAVERLAMRIHELIKYTESLEAQIQELRAEKKAASGMRDEQARKSIEEIDRVLKRASEIVVSPEYSDPHRFHDVDYAGRGVER